MYCWIASAFPFLISKFFVRLNEVVQGEVYEVSLPKLRLDDLLRLSKESSPADAWRRGSTNFSLCLPLNCRTWMLIRHESVL